ncbi:MAG: serine protease AprX, partial [Flavobacteriales bacterium]
MTKGNGFRSILIVFFFIWVGESIGQEGKYWVYLTDKKETTFDPSAYFHPAALERRVKQGLPLADSSDYPVSPSYIEIIQELGVEFRNESRWLNAISCLGTEQQMDEVRMLPFVRSTSCIVSEAQRAQVIDYKYFGDESASAMEQTAMLGEADFEAAGLRGKGIRIAIFDVGFKGYLELPEFAHLREANAIEQVYDFVGKDRNVSKGGTHGTAVFSCIGGIDQGQKMGLATEATYLLARTERHHVEIGSEEDCWIAAAEWADKNGVHIINSSLGYTNHRYFRHMMDGKTAPVSKAATWAAKKGILVVNAVGNDGDTKWKFIGAPADADSVLSVGGIDPYNYFPANFTSLGPTSDGRMKPNVVAFGFAKCATPKGLRTLSGTSFSSPLIAGFAACTWQANQTLTNMEIFDLIEQSGQLYPYYDYSVGFGVPQARVAIGKV